MLDFASVSKIGGREVNEDTVNIVVDNDKYGFIVCDGLGGHSMGDIASQTVSKAFESYLKGFDNNDALFLPKMFDEAQKLLLKKQKELNKKMCTTATALYVSANKAYIGHIGDSRLYAFENGICTFKTVDHSLVQMLAIRGEISEEEMAHHPQRNKLLRAMGDEWEKPMYSVLNPIEIKNNQAFLLCTDGFWEWIDIKTIGDLLFKSENAEEWLSKMVEIVEKNQDTNKADNYSAIVVMNK